MQLKTLLNYRKTIVLCGAFFVVGLFLWYAYFFFNAFKSLEQERMAIWATAQTQLLAADPNMPMGELVLKIFQSNKQTPMLLLQLDGTYSLNNLEGVSAKTAKDIAALKRLFTAENPPIEMSDKGTLLATLYYGESESLKRLKYYPLGLLGLFLVFSGLLYYVLRLDKRASQNILWVSMAKETAHQIATPLSALMAWNDLLKAQKGQAQVSGEIEKDLERLSLINQRFSRIGNLPVLEVTNLSTATQQGVAYLKTRLSSAIEIHIETTANKILVPLNNPLYFWCLENIIKNSVDAMKGKGSIRILIEATHKKGIVRVIDQGNGVSKKAQKQLFNAGFSTKKSGWGMGLSLAKRIVEDYHNGQLFLGKTSVNGSEMVLEFPL